MRFAHASTVGASNSTEIGKSTLNCLRTFENRRTAIRL